MWTTLLRGHDVDQVEFAHLENIAYVTISTSAIPKPGIIPGTVGIKNLKADTYFCLSTFSLNEKRA